MIPDEIRKTLQQYNGFSLFDEPSRWLKNKSWYCHNTFRGFHGEEIYAESDDDNRTEYYVFNTPFAESFTSDKDRMCVYAEFMIEDKE